MVRGSAAVALLAATGLLAAGCGAAGVVERSSSTVGGAARPVTGGTPLARVHTCAPGTRPVDNAVAAVVVRPTTVYAAPGGPPLRRFGLRNVNGARNVFSVLGRQVDARCRALWLHVEVPLRPNGATGWVRAADTRTIRIRTRIVVDLSARRVRLYRAGRLVLSSVAAVGAPATPTPVGRYYVNQRLVPSNPNGPFGPGAVGISAFSPVLTTWVQGGPIAIHGTNEPWSIGHAVSNGCIRLPNRVLARLFRETPVGTPVIIRRA